MFGAIYREYLIIYKFYKSNSHMTRLFRGGHHNSVKWWGRINRKQIPLEDDPEVTEAVIHCINSDPEVRA